MAEIACWTCGSPRSLKTSFPWQLKAAVRGHQLASDKRKALETPFDVYVIGWADDGPYALMLSNHDLHGFPAWKAQDLPFGVFSPPLDDRLFERVDKSSDRIDMLPEIFEAQVQAEPTIVGGWVQQTTVTEFGIFTNVIGKIPKA